MQKDRKGQRHIHTTVGLNDSDTQTTSDTGSQAEQHFTPVKIRESGNESKFPISSLIFCSVAVEDEIYLLVCRLKGAKISSFPKSEGRENNITEKIEICRDYQSLRRPETSSQFKSQCQNLILPKARKMRSSCIIIIAVAFAAATLALSTAAAAAHVLGQDASESEGRGTSDPPISQVAASSKPAPGLPLPSPPTFSSEPSHMPLTSSSSEQMWQGHQFPDLPAALSEEGNMRTAAGITPPQTKASAEAQAKGPIMTSLASVFALSFFHKEKMRRCCALRLCPCRGQMGFPAPAPGGMAGFPPSGGGGNGGMGGMYPGPGMGMRPPGMGGMGFRPPGMGNGFGGMGGMGGMGGGGGGGGEDEGNEELQDGYEDIYTYHVRPGSRPSGMQKRKRPISMRPHHLRPDMVAASAPSPDTNYPASSEGGVKWTSGSEGDVAGSSEHVAGGMLAERQQLASGPSPVSRRLMSLEKHPATLTVSHEEDMSCSRRSPGVGKNSRTNVLDTSHSRVIAAVGRNDSRSMSSRRHEAEDLAMHSYAGMKQNASLNPHDSGLF